MGHRESEDLDFFTQANFDPVSTQILLAKTFKLSDIVLDHGTLNCFASGVKLQFLHYPYRLLKTTQQYLGIHVASVQDIACSKLLTVSDRGSKKDFVDIYFILKHYSLTQLFQFLAEKYPDQNYNLLHILKSLVYFVDAEGQPMPRMHKDVSWQTIKNSISTTIKEYSL